MSSVINTAGLFAVWRRQLSSLLGNPLGYIFILAFVVASAAILFIPNVFFARNVADLGYLLSWDGFPMMAALLAVVVPALTMGSWASERETGTEELLLTMPLSLVDALLGKYLAVMTFVTIALICSLSNVAVLSTIGDPDVGLVFANYLGFWLAAAAFAAWSLFASVLVTMPAIAFVFGAALSGILLVLGWWAGFFEDFNRGVLPVSGVITALTAAGLGLASALLLLASRRWRAGHEERTLAHCIAGVLVLLLAVNLWRIGDRFGIDSDLSHDGVASLAEESVTILNELDRPVRLTAFISQRLPETVQLTAKELEDRLRAIERFGGDRITLTIHRPKDALAPEALHARRDFNLQPRRDVVESVVGKELEEVFLSVAIASGGRTQLIEYVDPGLHVEYELMQAINAVGSDTKRVIGIAMTDLEMGPGFDMRTQGMRQAWQIHSEWAKQYDVRDVDLDQPVAAEIEALIVPQPSSLTDARIRNLHDYIWAGRPTLLLEDPLPVFTNRPDLNASQPRQPQNNPYGGQQEQEPKGDLGPLLRSLGLDFNLNNIVWSDYNPSHAFRGLIPRSFVWLRRTGEGDDANFADSPITRGFTDLLLPFPGMIRIAEDKPSGLTVTPLLQPTPGANWGWHRFGEHFESSPWGGGLTQKEPARWVPAEADDTIAFAVQVTGTMPSAYPQPDPTDAQNGEHGEDPEKTGDARVGVPSTSPVNVVVVADNDFCNDLFFQFYRDVGRRISQQQDTSFLRDLRNVQFAANLVDILVGENELVGVRSRQPPIRKLDFIDQQIAVAQKHRGIAEDLARNAATGEIEIAKAELEEHVAAIAQRTDLDASAKANLAEAARMQRSRALEVQINQINADMEAQILAARADQQRGIAGIRTQVRLSAIIIPIIVLAGIALMVFLRRIIRERTHIPAARTRSTP